MQLLLEYPGLYREEQWLSTFRLGTSFGGFVSVISGATVERETKVFFRLPMQRLSLQKYGRRKFS
ncbi:MAG: hypothetical protein ABI477_10665 [Chryseolinea sp.]